MKDCIYRDAAYSIAKKVVDAIANGEYHAGVFAYDIMDWIDELPAADVAPVVHGTWDKGEDYDPYGGGRFVEWSCSECCHIIKRGWAVRGKNIDEKPTENYCPKCGARMDESEWDLEPIVCATSVVEDGVGRTVAPNGLQL